MTKPFHIQKPCSENWEKMSPAEQGRHCAKCSLTVLDFTSMSDNEVLNVLHNRQGQRTCGRIRKKIEVIHLPEVLISDSQNSFHFQSASRLFTFSVCAMLLAACQNNPNTQRAETSADSALVQVDSNITVPDTLVAVATAIDSIKHHPKPPKPEPYIDIMGDIAIDPSIEKTFIPLPEDFAQIGEVTLPEDTVSVAAVQAEYPGGQDSLFQFIKQQMNYPKSAKDSGIEGRVIAKFVVTTSGEIANIQIVRSIPNAPEFDTEVIRVLKLMPKWKPALDFQNRPVNIWYHVPVLFKLND
ncbi:MAG: energy transducer TonB [Bacteroidetes bacterium]|nr:MAG: energy transducer TonB [Bacteroidota bacterium]